MLKELIFTALICVATCQFGFQPYGYRPYPYGYQPYAPSYNNYYRAPAPVPSPYRFGQPPPQPLPSPYTQTASNLGNLPMGMYDNFVCNSIAGKTRKRRDTRSPDFIQSPGLLAYQKLFSFTDPKLHQQLWEQTHYLARQGFSADAIIKVITVQRMKQDGENGNINDIYNAINYLSTQSKSVVQETQKRAGTSICQSTTAFYCNYINKLRASAQYCSGAVLSNQVYQQCCSQYGSSPTPVPSPYTAPTNPTPTPTPTPTTTNTSTKTCGISTPNPAKRMGEFSDKLNQMRIVGGVTTEKCEYPWMVRLRMGSSMCGGSIIDAYHIVTAAHCVGQNTAGTISVHAGEYDYRNANEPNDQVVPAASIIKHPNYRDLPNGEQENDIAIIKLARPLQMNSCVQPVCLAEAGDGQKLPPGTQCTTAGWGTTSTGGQTSHVLQETTIPTYSGFDCSRYFSQTVPSSPNLQLCAGRPVIGGADTCQGDSGGPLFCPINGRYVQYGVVSYGAGCASAGAAGVYTDVGNTRNFIDQVVNNQFGK